MYQKWTVVFKTINYQTLTTKWYISGVACVDSCFTKPRVKINLTFSINKYVQSNSKWATCAVDPGHLKDARVTVVCGRAVKPAWGDNVSSRCCNPTNRLRALYKHIDRHGNWTTSQGKLGEAKTHHTIGLSLTKPLSEITLGSNWRLLRSNLRLFAFSQF